MGWGLAIGAGLSLIGAKKSSDAAKAASRSEKAALAERKRLAAKHAKEIEARGLVEAEHIRGEALKYRGTQVARLASSGVVVGNGSAKAIAERTVALGEADALVAIEDSRNKAQQVRDDIQYDAMATSSRVSAIAARNKANLFGTAGQIASSFG